MLYKCLPWYIAVFLIVISALVASDETQEKDATTMNCLLILVGWCGHIQREKKSILRVNNCDIAILQVMIKYKISPPPGGRLTSGTTNK
jgi:hypothetical protein